MSKKSRRKAREKAEKAAFIADISFDGKINKKEAEKAAERGISLQTIQNENIRTFNSAKENYDPDLTTTGRYGRGTVPTFQPLLIKRKARDTFNSSSQAPGATDPATTAPVATDTATEIAPVQKEPTAQQLFEEYKAGLPDYGAQLQTMQNNFGTQISGLMDAIKGYDDKFLQQQQNYQQQMTDMRQTLTAQMNPATRNPIFGVRGTPPGVGQRIMRDSFGRRGSRIQGIRNTTLNVS